MAHELDFTVEGDARMFYVNSDGLPWHGLGTPLDNPATAAEAIKAGGLDWIVRMSPMYIRGETDNLLGIPDHFATTRNVNGGREVLGIVSKQYVPIQNRDAFKVGDMLVGEGAAIYHTAGSLRGGRKVWVLMKMPDSIEVTDQDIVDKYLLFTTSHDGSEAARMLFTPIRVVCHNTLSAAISGQGMQARVLHTGDLKWQFQNAIEFLGIVNNVFEDTAKDYRMLADNSLTVARAKGFFDELIPNDPESERNTFRKNQRAAMLHFFENGKGADLAGTRGTVWQAYNAVTEYVDHTYMARSDDDKRLGRSWLGSGRDLRDRAFVMAKKLVA